MPIEDGNDTFYLDALPTSLGLISGFTISNYSDDMAGANQAISAVQLKRK